MSTLVAIVVARHQWKEKRRDVCLKLWQLWTSYEFKKSRSRAYQYLHYQAHQDNVIDLITLRHENSELREDFSVVFHFFKDLYIMIRRGMVDRSLAKQLFMDEVNEWFRYLNPSEKSIINRPGFRIWEDEHRTWGEKFVLPLKAELESCPNKPRWL